ncbi:MAG: hypothetical protein H0V72_30905 [Bradyrhizobium sp.]|nr:hypothetical protein [Bradyrhizobium sp.]
MAKPDAQGPASDPRELTLEELDNISAGHGVAIPPQGFDKLEQINSTTAPPKPVTPIGNKII